MRSTTRVPRRPPARAARSRRLSGSSTDRSARADRGGPPRCSDERRRRTITDRRDTRVNDRIRAREVRLVGADGEQLGITGLPEALATARAAGLDLVEVAPQAVPPVCKVMDWGKHLYDESMRQKESKRKQAQIVVKEMKFRPKIDSHDYETKKKHVVRFLDEASKVKITIMFRGREMTHTELGARILDRLAEDLAEIATVEAPPKLDGRNMIMVLAPIRTKEPGKGDGDDGDVEPAKETHKGRHKGKGRTRRSAEEAAADEALPPAEEGDDVSTDAAEAVADEVVAEVADDAADAEAEEPTDDADRSE